MLAVVAILTVSALLIRLNLLMAPVSSGPAAPRVIEIPEGATVRQVADLLQSNGLIRNAFFFRILAEYRGLSGKVRAGEYELSPAMSPSSILNHLVNGPILTHPFTIPEGLTVRQIAETLAAKGIVDRDEFLAAARDPGVQVKEPLEGYLFPDTYRVRKGTSEGDIVQLMVSRFREVFDEGLRRRAEELGMTVHQVVTLASIIEKEAVVEYERPLISGVFHNRLKMGMKLDADPTVRYALDKFQGPVTFRDTKSPSPYNTYMQPGLPPGPIACPGLASIRAALYPAEVKYLYFVAKNDGTHYFSTTLRDHINAVRKYRPYGQP